MATWGRPVTGHGRSERVTRDSETARLPHAGPGGRHLESLNPPAFHRRITLLKPRHFAPPSQALTPSPRKPCAGAPQTCSTPDSHCPNIQNLRALSFNNLQVFNPESPKSPLYPQSRTGWGTLGSACHRAKLGHASHRYVNPSSNRSYPPQRPKIHRPHLCHRQSRSHTPPARRTRPAGPPAADSTPFTQSYFTPNWLRSIDPHSRPAPAGACQYLCRYPPRSGSPHSRANGSFTHFHAAHSQPCTNRNDGEWFRKLKSRGAE